MARQAFEAELEGVGPNGSWVKLTVPFSVEQVFGSKARVSVQGTMNGFPFRTSLFPNGDGTHHMMVNREMRQGAGAGPGERVAVVLEADTTPRTVAVPADLTEALGTDPETAARFEKLACSHRKEYVDWIEGAKQAETRARRIQRTLEMVANGQRAKS